MVSGTCPVLVTGGRVPVTAAVLYSKGKMSSSLSSVADWYSSTSLLDRDSLFFLLGLRGLMCVVTLEVEGASSELEHADQFSISSSDSELVSLRTCLHALCGLCFFLDLAATNTRFFDFGATNTRFFVFLVGG